MGKDLENFMQRQAKAETGEPVVGPASMRIEVEEDAPAVAPGDVQLPGVGSNTANRLIRPEGTRPCPICDAAMETWQEFGVLFDVCMEHGVWLDKGELETLADLRSRASRQAMQATIDELRSRPRGDDNLIDVAGSFLNTFFN